uniref:AlNc14C255G9710 protein n=1 Tax=Albugo laibachii Nc14 TaxID=890382 RepID=F0WTN3_9STRA|nr:AlNc14C255G9710 [Albugo laibachii Nc14]|eukprot:CCA24725.1 AlNc14C255G9710 [Albugo laibachii Nc14]
MSMYSLEPTSDQYSECVLAYHEDAQPCHECLNSGALEAKESSSIASLLTVPHDKKILVQCITTNEKKACRNIVFLPNQICYHDSKISVKNILNHIKELFSRKSPSTLPLPLSEIERDTPAFSNDLDQLVTFELVHFKSYACLACYTLLHNVLFVSIKKEYFWMEKEQAVPMKCNCELGHTESKFKHGMHSLRPMSFKTLNSHLPRTDNIKSADMFPINVIKHGNAEGGSRIHWE